MPMPSRKAIHAFHVHLRLLAPATVAREGYVRLYPRALRAWREGATIDGACLTAVLSLLSGKGA